MSSITLENTDDGNILVWEHSEDGRFRGKRKIYLIQAKLVRETDYAHGGGSYVSRVKLQATKLQRKE